MIMDHCKTDRDMYTCLIQNGILSVYDIMAQDEKLIDLLVYIVTGNSVNKAQRVGLSILHKHRLNILINYQYYIMFIY